jgi:two-component system cell cycle response regulator
MAARILVVDDLLPNIKVLEAKLKNEFYRVATAQSGAEAIEKIKIEQPDVILLDVMMPDMDGFETCRRIKANPISSSIPVVMVTALSDVEDRVRGLDAGADDFLTKPINDLALFARIRSLVRLKSMTDELRLRDQTGEQFGGVIGNDSINDVSGAKILLIDDDASQASQIKTKLQEVGVAVSIIPDPAEAVESTENIEYDLIIVSTQLTTDDGMHLCTHLRSQDRTISTPLLIIIEDSDTDLLVKGFDMGINDYLMTPIDSNEVVARVKIQVRRKRFQDALQAKGKKSLDMAIKDGLTNIFNRRYFDIHVERIMANAIATGKPLSLMILDLDHFKMVNDTYGHQSGDAILKQLPQRILRLIRPTDLFARYGGEEFVVVMPDTTVVNAANVAERIRRVVESEDFIIPVQPGTLKKTVSIGVSVSEAGDTAKDILARADKALYHIKKTCRNKVAVVTKTNVKK